MKRIFSKRKKVYAFSFLILFRLNNFCESFTKFDDFDFKTDSIILYNVNSDSNIFEKNSNKIRPPASLTKIMTFIVVNDLMRDGERRIKIKKELLDTLSGTDSSLAELDVNYAYSINELLLCMMVRSGNDAALVLADYFGGGDVNNFVKKMNEKGEELNCKCTHFMNPHGLHDNNHYSSCEDMLKIIKHAMKIESFANIVKTQSVVINGTEYKNTNKLLDPKNEEYYYQYNKGIKTGYHSEAGSCFSSFCEKNGIKFFSVFMGAPFDKNQNVNYAMKETKNLCDSAFNKLTLRKVRKKLPKDLIKCDRSGVLVVDYKNTYTIEYMSPKNVKGSDIKIETDIYEPPLPIHEGDLLGTINIKYNNDTLKKVDINAKKYIDSSFKCVFSSMMKHLFLL